MLSKEILQKIETEARKHFRGSSGCHDWSHVERVLKLALHIGREEKANLEVRIYDRDRPVRTGFLG